MKKILISGGQYTVVDDADFEWLAAFRWTAQKRKHGFHAARYIGKKYVYMHRLILAAAPGIEVDHKDGDGLNNQRKNLRLATKSQNAQGFRHLKGRTSQYRGVFWHQYGKCFAAQIHVRGRKIFLGVFDDEVSAARAYDKEARIQFGEFAQCNFN